MVFRNSCVLIIVLWAGLLHAKVSTIATSRGSMSSGYFLQENQGISSAFTAQDFARNASTRNKKRLYEFQKSREKKNKAIILMARYGRRHGRPYPISDPESAKCYHIIEAQITAPVAAYKIQAQASLRMMRYMDAIRLAKATIRQSEDVYYGERWIVHRINNLRDCHKILYNSYMNLGEIEKASSHYREYLMLSKVLNSRPMKDAIAETVMIGMTSHKLLHDYKAAVARANTKQCLAGAAAAVMVAASVAAAANPNPQYGNNNNNQAALLHQQQMMISTMQVVALSTIAIENIEKHKGLLKSELNIDLDEVLADAAKIGDLSSPTEEDIRNAKLASELYLVLNAQSASGIVDVASPEEIKDLISSSMSSVAIELCSDGSLRLSGDLAALLYASMKIDQMPFKIVPNTQVGAKVDLGQDLPNSLYKVSGLRMTAEEKAFFENLKMGDTQSLTFSPNDPRARVALNGIRRMQAKSKELEKWYATQK